MNKNDLITVLNTGLEKGRLSTADYAEAIQLYELIYEKKIFSESSSEHEKLSSLINRAAGTTSADLVNMLKTAAAAANGL